MVGSGLSDILDQTASHNHDVRKAVGWALHGFFLVDASLAVLLIHLLLPSSDSTDIPGLSNDDLQDIQPLDH